MAPYTSKHPIPTVQKYRENRSDLDKQRNEVEKAQEADEGDENKVKRAFGAVKKIFKGEDDEAQGDHDPYPSENRNFEHENSSANDGRPQPPAKDKPTDSNGDNQSGGETSADDKKKSGTESTSTQVDPRQKRKEMKHMDRDTGGRQVTDPVTHLPIEIRDSTQFDLKHTQENEPAPGEISKSQTGASAASKSQGQLDEEHAELQRGYDSMQKTFPPPDFDDTKKEVTKLFQFALTVGLGSIGVLALLTVVMLQLFGLRQSGRSVESDRPSDSLTGTRTARVFIPITITIVLSSVAGGALIYGIRGWLGKKVEAVWEDEVWDSARQEENETQQSDNKLPESVAWLNSLLASIWPLINPDLFTSLSDMLEDVMQASLPKLVRMVSVDDLGQGNEAFRILGIRWLPTGAASQTVGEDGEIKESQNGKGDTNDRSAAGEGQEDTNATTDQDDQQKSKGDSKDSKQDEEEQEATREGLEAEQGDFVNMEMAFAYRARSSGKSIKSKARNAHLYLKFYFPGGIAIPVWVELRGIIGTMRLRLQLTPDPPFFSLCTLSFLGQPKADLSCVPLSKHNLNLMDVPLISSFVQSSIDAALAEYVAPKSLTLDLKEMMMGDDFKKDTNARGILVVLIKSARGFKEGDGGIGPMKGSSDAYVTVSWGKFGKPLSSTRIIIDEQKPTWNEWSYLLVGPEELNADEQLRLQLWDSDKRTADDDLGRVAVSLKDLMNNSDTKNRVCDREDRFTAEDPDEEMPGTISWTVGYFSKKSVTDEQLAKQTADENIRSKDDLKRKASESAKRKLREATNKDESTELQQQRAQDYKEKEDGLIISAPPDENYPSGILSIQIHNVTGLEVENLRKRHGRKGDTDGETEQSSESTGADDLPSSYCVLILNHEKIYRTRTKPKNGQPFFNAGTEKFVRDWRTAEVIASVRDAREGEEDALLGVVYLPLHKVFAKRAQTNETYPLAGGIGFGKVRISMVWRSTEVHLPKELQGWDYGTLEVKTPIQVAGSLPDDLKSLRLKIRSNIARGKLYSQSQDSNNSSTQKNDGWSLKKAKDKSVFLAVHKRYACPMTIEWRKSVLGPDSTAAFAVYWLKDMPDDEENDITLKVWKGSKDAFKRARTCDGFEEFVKAGSAGQGETNGDQKDAKDLKAELVGEVSLTLKFHPGLSGWHKHWAEKSSHGSGTNDVLGVMEVLDVVGDVEGESPDPGDEEDSNASDSSGDDGSDGGQGEDDDTAGAKIKATLKSPVDSLKKLGDSHNDPDDGKRGPINQIRDYKDHAGSLHRSHRGIMQWRGARKMNWMMKEAKGLKGSVQRVFEHDSDSKDPGIETEV